MIRWRPRYGPARTTLEQLVQHLWRNRILYYIAFVVTLSLVLQFTFARGY